MEPGNIKIAGININNLTYNNFRNLIKEKISGSKLTLITYANANTINSVYNNIELKNIISSFDVIHPDGIGIYLAGKLLYGKHGFGERITGSDFYHIFIEDAIKNNWKLFFFGHDDITLTSIKLKNPGLSVCGIQNGYDYNNDEVLNKINNAAPDVLIVGLSFPIQEKWLVKYKNNLKCKAAICVGDGIKVFAGTKRRGPKIMQILGLEWFIRLLSNPIKMFKRYVIGNPLFLCRIFITKIRKLRE